MSSWVSWQFNGTLVRSRDSIWQNVKMFLFSKMPSSLFMTITKRNLQNVRRASYFNKSAPLRLLYVSCLWLFEVCRILNGITLILMALMQLSMKQPSMTKTSARTVSLFLAMWHGTMIGTSSSKFLLLLNVEEKIQNQKEKK